MSTLAVLHLIISKYRYFFYHRALLAIPEVLQPCPEYPGLGVDIGDAQHEHSPAQVMVKVHALAHLAARHR